MRTARGTQQGFSLTELMFVLLVLAIVVAITIPASTGRSALRLERAGREVADALNFARAEALRTNVSYGVRVQGGRRIAVFRLDRSVTPPAERYDVYHPLDKSLYSIDLSGGLYTAGTTATGYFLFQGAGAADQATSFDANGEAMRGDDGRPLATGGVLLGNDGSTLTVALAPLIGRTTIGAVTGAVADPRNAFVSPVQP
jgi:prepilin-type N-terminal cleavage/methylation domain-containing protein